MASAPARVDGVSIAADLDDDDGVPSTAKSDTEGPSKAGSTPIAEGFDD